MENVNYKGNECVNFTNGTLDLLIPKHFGPRVLFAGFKGGENNFGVVDDVGMDTPNGKWNIHGGHRFWLAPETWPDTYYPDDEDVSIVESGGGVAVSQNIPAFCIKKELVLSFLGKNRVKAVHNVHNNGGQTNEFAAWALSLMRTGGFAIVPQNIKKEDEHAFLPNRNLVLWTYTNVLDKRFKMTPKFFYVKQGGPKPFKIGQRVTLGWAAYFNKGNLFVKRFPFETGKTYPDFQCNVEIYSCPKFLEVESISPMVKLEAGGVYTYVEEWEFYRGRKIAFGAKNVKI
jgi:hypothetical protein